MATLESSVRSPRNAPEGGRGSAAVAAAEVEFEFEPALVVEAGVNDNITVALDLARWFRNETGALLPPSAENQSRIEQNIATTFDVFGDRDRDGKEDSGRLRHRSRWATP